MSNIKDASLWQSGKDKIDWVRSYMPLLTMIEEDFKKNQPFAGMKISMSIHLEAKTANLAKVLRAGGAEVRVTGCNPLSTQDDVAAALVHEGFEVNAVFTKKNDLPDYQSMPSHECPMCKNQRRLDAMVNAFGVSSFGI